MAAKNKKNKKKLFNLKETENIEQFKRKKKKKNKSKQQLDEERKQREVERAQRDAEKAKKRLSLRAKIINQKSLKQKEIPKSPQTAADQEKEKRKKVLRYRRAQSRFALPKITMEDNLEAIAAANAALMDDGAFPNTENKENKENDDKKEEKNDDDKKSDDNDDNNDDDDNEDNRSMISYQSVEELTLSEEQEQALNKLQNDLEEADPDYYGFVDYSRFQKILKSNDINLSAKHDTFLMGALTLIDEGVDYYAFARKIREVGRELQPDNTLQDICEEIAETVEKAKEKEKQTADLPDTSMEKYISVDEDEFEKFYKEAQKNRGRGMSLMRMKSASAEVDKKTKLGELIDDLALDGAEIDYALLKTALATIDCYPPDKDLKYLINHLCEDGSGFIDFNYLLSFLQETSNIPATKWKNVEKIITKVVNSLRMVERAEERKKIQQQKLKERLNKRRETAKLSKNSKQEELKQIEAEEKRLRALKLREKAKKQYK